MGILLRCAEGKVPERECSLLNTVFIPDRSRRLLGIYPSSSKERMLHCPDMCRLVPRHGDPTLRQMSHWLHGASLFSRAPLEDLKSPNR